MKNYKSKLNKKIDASVSSHSFGWLFESDGISRDIPVTSLFRWNSLFVYGIFFVVGILFFSQLGYIQVLNGAYYRNKSETNKYSEIKIRAPRGVVYDNKGVQLTNNAPAFRLMIDLSVKEINIDELVSKLSVILEVEQEEIQKRIDEKSAVGQKKILVKRELTKDQFLLINANESKLLGAYIEEDMKRVYPYQNYLSHILGYTGEVSEYDLEKSDRYSSGDIIGKLGLEYQYEDFLRGKDGQQSVVIDVSGNIISEQSVVKPESGKNLRLSIDIEVQKFLHDALQKGIEESRATGAAALIANINTGELIAAVSLPSYDNNLFIGGISYDEYDVLSTDASRPMLNRYIGAAQPPGSTFKTITATAGLDSGAITEATIYNSTGVFYLGSYPFQEFRKKAYGPINVVQAITKSSNIFFYETVLNMGIDTLVDYADRFGLSRNTGIDIPGEIVGNYSSPEYKALLTDEIWYPGDSLNASIGQGYHRITPVQMLRWTSAIGNGGTLVIPHFMTEYQNELGIWEKAEYGISKLDVKDKPLEIVRRGMRESVATGVVYTLRNTSVPVAAKTGTAEFGIKDERGFYTKTHAWVTGFFPYDEPKYSFTFFQEAGGLGSDSGKVVDEFINWFVEYENSL